MEMMVNPTVLAWIEMIWWTELELLTNESAMLACLSWLIVKPG